ncbi:MAG: hypothetical protein AB2L14_04910 [Candidatus Xenobiia bacterium LiM19]
MNSIAKGFNNLAAVWQDSYNKQNNLQNEDQVNGIYPGDPIDSVSISSKASSTTQSTSIYYGGDVYYMQGNALMKTVNDSTGNEIYTMSNSCINSSLTVSDKEGNDSYNVYGQNNTAKITDNGGDDKYTLSGSNNKLTITDSSGINTVNLRGKSGDWTQSTDNSGNKIYKNKNGNVLTVIKGSEVDIKYID